MATCVTIIGEHKQRRTFDSPDEFNTYYETHKADIDSRTTNQLNRELSVTGYKIARRNMRVVDGRRIGDLHLIPIRDNTANDDRCNAADDQWEVIRGIASEVDRIKAKMKSLDGSISHILAIINNG